MIHSAEESTPAAGGKENAAYGAPSAPAKGRPIFRIPKRDLTASPPPVPDAVGGQSPAPQPPPPPMLELQQPQLHHPQQQHQQQQLAQHQQQQLAQHQQQLMQLLQPMVWAVPGAPVIPLLQQQLAPAWGMLPLGTPAGVWQGPPQAAGAGQRGGWSRSWTP